MLSIFHVNYIFASIAPSQQIHLINLISDLGRAISQMSSKLDTMVSVAKCYILYWISKNDDIVSEALVQQSAHKEMIGWDSVLFAAVSQNSLNLMSYFVFLTIK